MKIQNLLFVMAFALVALNMYVFSTVVPPIFAEKVNFQETCKAKGGTTLRTVNGTQLGCYIGAVEIPN